MQYNHTYELRADVALEGYRPVSVVSVNCNSGAMALNGYGINGGTAFATWTNLHTGGKSVTCSFTIDVLFVNA